MDTIVSALNLITQLLTFTFQFDDYDCDEKSGIRLNIYDGTDTSNLMANICSTYHLNQTIFTSTGSSLYLQFYSDDELTVYPGFRATYTKV